jgi:uncharacterized protein (TIGR02594 family)
MLEIQKQLQAAGFDPGPLDGIWGAKTRSAVLAFQRAKGLVVDGVVGPMTLRALGITTDKAPVVAGATIPDLPWMKIALAKLGQEEHMSTLKAFLKSDGRAVGDPAVIPWCGDFIETCIRLAIPDVSVPANPYLARNWAEWGQGVKPQYGSILVFWRGSKDSISGHVTFYVGENESSYLCLGGNQGNEVNKSFISKSRLLAARFPYGFTAQGGTRMVTDDHPKTTNES